MKLLSYNSVGQKSNMGLSLGQNQDVSRAMFSEAFGEKLFPCFFQLPEASTLLDSQTPFSIFKTRNGQSSPSHIVCFFDPSSIVTSLSLSLATARKVSLLLSMNSRHQLDWAHRIISHLKLHNLSHICEVPSAM